MSVEKVKKYLSQFGYGDRVREFHVSSATVGLAAQALDVEPARIAKTISLQGAGGCVMLVTAGDRKLDNAKFKAEFGFKAKMLKADEVEPSTGFPVGGVCPFAVKPGVQVFLDESLRRFDTVFPAAGSGNSAIELSCAELEKLSRAAGWVDVCKIIEF